MVRGGEAAGREPVNRIALDPAGGPVILTLELAAVKSSAYSAALRDSGGKEIWQGAGLRPNSTTRWSSCCPPACCSPVSTA
jgi:hypothetical protein